MKKEYCLDLEGDVYSIGDLNLFLDNPPMDYPPVDPERPEKPFFTGRIVQQVQVKGNTRNFLLYLPPDFPISGAGIFLYPDSGVTADAFLTQSGWQQIADDTCTALIILESEMDGWSQCDIQREISYSEAVFKKAISRMYFSLNESSYYIMGFGQGAYTAVAYALLNSALFAAMAVDGCYQLHPALLQQLGRIRSDRDVSCSKLDVAMPAWLLNAEGDDGGTVLACLQKACGVSQDGLQCEDALLFRQNLKQYFSTPNGLPMAEVRFTGATLRNRMEQSMRYRRMAEFVLGFKRWLGIGNGDLRPARSWQEMQLKRFETKLDGRKREWYVYEPTVYRQQPERKRPLVLAIHGYSCTGPIFAENSQWHELAERREFFVTYLSAYPSSGITAGRTVPLPTWNALGIQAETDDIKYVTYVLEQVQKNWPIDPERIYVTGHSNGSLLTQRLMEEQPLNFAAFGPQGAPYHLDLQGNNCMATSNLTPDGIVRPVWLMMGQEDIGDQDRLDCGSINDRFVEMMCMVNGMDSSHWSERENGKFRTRTYSDQKHVPLVRFTGIRDMPHAYTPETAQLYWDLFFCHFRRRADGKIIYTE